MKCLIEGKSSEEDNKYTDKPNKINQGVKCPLRTSPGNIPKRLRNATEK